MGSAAEVAVTVTPEPGAAAGAVYSPVLVTVPTVGLPPATPFTLHVTPRFRESFCTAAVNCWVVETFKVVDAGATDTLIEAVTLIVAKAVLVVSATDVAVSMTVAGLGVVDGVLYVTEAFVTLLSVPQAVPAQPVPERDQITPLLCVSLVTVALKFCVPPIGKLALVGRRVIKIAGPAAKVMVTTLDFVPSRFDVAVRVTAAGLGKLAGAV